MMNYELYLPESNTKYAKPEIKENMFRLSSVNYSYCTEGKMFKSWNKVVFHRITNKLWRNENSCPFIQLLLPEKKYIK